MLEGSRERRIDVDGIEPIRSLKTAHFPHLLPPLCNAGT